MLNVAAENAPLPYCHTSHMIIYVVLVTNICATVLLVLLVFSFFMIVTSHYLDFNKNISSCLAGNAAANLPPNKTRIFRLIGVYCLEPKSFSNSNPTNHRNMK